MVRVPWMVRVRVQVSPTHSRTATADPETPPKMELPPAHVPHGETQGTNDSSTTGNTNGELNHELTDLQILYRRYPHIRPHIPNTFVSCEEIRAECVEADIRSGCQAWNFTSPFTHVRELRLKKMRERQEEATLIGCTNNGIQYKAVTPTTFGTEAMRNTLTQTTPNNQNSERPDTES